MTRIFFNLDGTVITKETLPLISTHFGVQEEIDALTKDTINGNIPFVESFIRRVHILGKIDVIAINNLLSDVPLYHNVFQFIRKNADSCAIVTGNISCWIKTLIDKIGVTCYCSEGLVINNKVEKLTRILKKENLVKEEQNFGNKVVFVGVGNNDMEAMRLADISIACGITHQPAASVLSIADYAVFSEEALCRQLNQLL
ncbi:hypothetical protein AGMMS49942_29480 [Spirochaetia bacterium]|nr:hypothetical protein AGMMS49942_29480 [Spirochaetia bacterium]